MKSNTLFERKTVAARPKPIRIPSEPYQTTSKRDIKFKVLPHEKKQLQLKALEENKSLTDFCSQTLRIYLEKGVPFNPVSYPNKEGVFIHVLLEYDFFKKIEQLHIEWGLSRRKTAHRIINAFLEREINGFEIVSYWGG